MYSPDSISRENALEDVKRIATEEAVKAVGDLKREPTPLGDVKPAVFGGMFIASKSAPPYPQPSPGENDWTMYSFEHSRMLSFFGDARNKLLDQARDYHDQHPEGLIKIS